MTWQGSIIAAMAGALLANVLALLVQRWRYSVDQWSARTTEFCDDIVALADLASGFWGTDRRKDDGEGTRELIRVRGGILRVEALHVALRDRCSKANALELQSRVGKLVNAITAGDFMKVPRKADSDRAMEVQAAAADLIAHLHDCRMASSSIRSAVERLVLRRFER
jgi:hypothetical protein